MFSLNPETVFAFLLGFIAGTFVFWLLSIVERMRHEQEQQQYEQDRDKFRY